MDLVDYSQARFDAIAAAFRAMAAPVQPANQVLHILPVSSLHGENVTRKSPHLDWYDGPTLLDVLHGADTHQRSALPGRLQVQRVLRPRHEGAIDVRTYAGRIASGTFAVGDDVVVQPGDRRSRIASLTRHGRVVTRAEAGESVEPRPHRRHRRRPRQPAGTARRGARRRGRPSTPRCAGWTSSRCASTACTCCSTASGACARR